MEEKHIKIISITLPILLVLMFALTYYNADRPSENESNYRLALKMQEQFNNSPAHVLLASEVIDKLSNDKTKISYLEVFNDKFSIPQTQLALQLEELEKEHKDIIYQHHSNNLHINKVLELNPRFRIVLAKHLDIDPSGLTDKDLINNQLSTNEIYLLKSFSQSEDLKLLLSENKLTKEYLDIDNLKRIYGNQHHVDPKREISNIE